MERSGGILSGLSALVGTTEPALKLLLTLLAGYPLALIHRKYLYNKERSLHHLFFITSGFLLGYWNYGGAIFHSVLAAFFTYCTLSILKGTSLSVAIVFLFNIGYLLIGYFYTSTESYDITWTMPQCIITLRLIGVAFDLYDGHQPVETLSSDSKKLALVQKPSILEIFGHSFFPSGFLIGPQFSMKRYLEFIDGHYNTRDGPPDSVVAAIKRGATGVAYLTIFQTIGSFVSDDYMLSDEFAQTCFFKRMLLLGLWGRYTLYKYISCWLLTEGACILFGIAQNGKDEKGHVKWDGVENIKLYIFENTTEFNHYIKSFNVNTNNWIAHYIYKRLKFLGNRQLSQLASLLFLAVWHGFHDGYYICFLFEFMVIYMERDIKSIVNSNDSLKNFFALPQLQLPLQIILRIYTFVFMGWCLLPFAFLKFSKYWHAMANVSYVGIILFVLWPFVYSPLIRIVLKKMRTKRTE
ncbi:lysophospholipid acyltransferase 5 [Diabrotica virgifera virgifera]|uniref:Lysophospholipid acyltransferase 5 n=1 Tax=Diabrotica virgifera virgifera TaxID=50390 RepID=A0A6P7FEX4_DIAVI|nr:lysophospholipid acyltransferase 5 [Diabrotica virgifera virgifera]